MPNTESSAGFIIFRKAGNKLLYLILHYSIGHWDFVKGKIEHGETETQAAMRECREETGITDIKILDGYREKITYHFKRAGKFVTKDAVFYLAQTQQDAVKLSNEHQGFRWLEYAEAYELTTFETGRQLLKKANAFLDENSKQKKLFSF